MANSFQWQQNHTAIQNIDGKVITHSGAMYQNLCAGQEAAKRTRYNNALIAGRVKPVFQRRDKDHSK